MKYILLANVYPAVAIPEKCLVGAPVVLSELRFLSTRYTRDGMVYEDSDAKLREVHLIDEAEILQPNKGTSNEDPTQDPEGYKAA